MPSNNPVYVPKIRKHALQCFQAGRLTEAKRLYEELCAANHKDANAWSTLGIINGQLGNIQEAEKCFRRAVHHQPGDSSAWGNLGIALMRQSRIKEARGCFQNALHINPDDVTAYNALGNLSRELGHLQDAVNFFKKALAISPDYAVAHNNLANIYKDRCQYALAQESYMHALKINPNFVDACFNLGTVKTATGDYDGAVASYRRALEIRPDFPEAVAAIASIHEKRQEYHKAYKTLEPHLSRNPVHQCIALTFADIAPRAERIPEAIQTIEQTLAMQGISPINRQELLFKLGDLYDKVNNFKKAFPAYQAANTARPYPFDPKSPKKQMEAIKSVFNKSGPETLARLNNDTELPVFIVGMPRSGTTLLEQILSSHPSVFGAGELTYLGDVISSAKIRLGENIDYPHLAKRLDTDNLETMAREYLDKLSTHSARAARITDKMPHNFLYLGLIDCLFPKARIIHCTREPLDTCLSIYFHNFNANHPYAGDLGNLGIYYNAYRNLMQHWKAVIRIPVKEVKYEDLVADQENISRDLVEFCGLNWDKRCLKFHESRRIVNTPSYDQVRQPLYTRSVGRWKQYKDFLQPLISSLEHKNH